MNSLRPYSATRSGSRSTSTSHSNITPRSSWYWTPSSTWSVACGSRSRFFAFCDFANVHPISPSPSGTYQSGTRWGRLCGPIVATLMIFCSSRKSRTSSGVMRIWPRREAIRARSVLGMRFDARTRLGRVEPQRRGGGAAEAVGRALKPVVNQIVIVRAAGMARLPRHGLPARLRRVGGVREQAERRAPHAGVVAAVCDEAVGADGLLAAPGRDAPREQAVEHARDRAV